MSGTLRGDKRRLYDVLEEQMRVLETERGEARELFATWIEREQRELKKRQLMLDIYKQEYPWIAEVLKARR